MGKIRNLWLTISLRKKIWLFGGMTILTMGISVLFNINTIRFSINSVNTILDDNSRCYNFQERLGVETQAFEAYVRERSSGNRERYIKACEGTLQSLRELPFHYRQIGTERYARTWNILNGYEEYEKYRDAIFQMSSMDAEFISSLYKVYAMQNYLQTYAMRLVQVTLEQGNASYVQKVPVFYYLPAVSLMVSGVMLLIVIAFTSVFSHTLISPMEKLARSARRIAKNDFSEEDVSVENKDEMGELVYAFNKMKHATQGYINTLEENYRIAELLHKEELEKIDTEKRLEATRLELLKSQINPHFLFNTLNMIASMARLEGADTSERMISSLSNLFRYNLNTKEQIVPLGQELRVLKDYMYIQQMRFGGRVRFDSSVRVDADLARIPAFTLQPLVENAIVHGLSKKEQGGQIYLKIWSREGDVMISIADTGLGMDAERKAEIEEALKDKNTSKVGIGLGNIYKRIHTLYECGELHIYSKEGKGTVIQMRIPQASEKGDKDVSFIDRR